MIRCLLKQNRSHRKPVVLEVAEEHNYESIMLIWSALGPLLLNQLVDIKRFVLLNCVRVDQKPTYFRRNQASDLLLTMAFKALLAHDQVLRHVLVARERDHASDLDMRCFKFPDV